MVKGYDSNKIEDIRAKLGYDSTFSMDHISQSGGSTIIWKQHMDCQILNFSSNYINVGIN